MGERGTKPDYLKTLTILKYMFSLALTICVTVNNNLHFFVVNILELGCIFLFTNILLRKKIVGRIINIILLFLYNVQMVIMLYANSYLSMVMLKNINSIHTLSGKAGTYIISFILVVIFSSIPVSYFEVTKTKRCVWLVLFFFIELGYMTVVGYDYSPAYGYYSLVKQQYKAYDLRKAIASEGVVSIDFYQEEITDYISKSTLLPKQPNVILIFTEGLSQSIIGDSRNIMPNVGGYQQKSINFDNYYNHTFATYRGLSGQLYSGYQLDDFDSNPLVSIQSIFSNLGYQTLFINTEPYNQDFTQYLEQFEFDSLIGDTSYKCDGAVDTISDKQAYEILYDTIMEYNRKKPFFISMYTFGTHVSLDTTDVKFEEGNDAELNKFFNLDYHFGEFMNKFEESTLAENTIIIFTTDHATYMDDSYNVSFSEHTRNHTFVDKIPLFIYYKGCEPQNIDVNGRNSLDLAPTILDYLDISAPNYFLGKSLFAEESNSILEFTSTDSNVYHSTLNGNISEMGTEEILEFDKIITEYYTTKKLAEKR